MAITNFSTLKSALSEWSDRTDVSDDALSLCVQMSTDLFNDGSEQIPALRVREMEIVANLTPVSGVCALPNDYGQYRRVVETASPRRSLEYVVPDAAEWIYADRIAGLAANFTIIGSSLYTFPLASNAIELTYYQRIPDLSDAAPTNWLITKKPSLYLHAGLFNLAMLVRDAELQQRSAGMVMSLISGMSGSDELANYAYAPGRVRGIVIA